MIETLLFMIYFHLKYFQLNRNLLRFGFSKISGETFTAFILLHIFCSILDWTAYRNEYDICFYWILPSTTYDSLNNLWYLYANGVIKQLMHMLDLTYIFHATCLQLSSSDFIFILYFFEFQFIWGNEFY